MLILTLTGPDYLKDCRESLPFEQVDQQTLHHASVNLCHFLLLHFILFSCVPTLCYCLSLSLPSFLYLPSSLLPSPRSINPSIQPSARGHLIAANLRRGSLEGFSAGLCSTGLLNAACSQGKWALRGGRRTCHLWLLLFTN